MRPQATPLTKGDYRAFVALSIRRRGMSSCWAATSKWRCRAEARPGTASRPSLPVELGYDVPESTWELAENELWKQVRDPRRKEPRGKGPPLGCFTGDGPEFQGCRGTRSP